MKIPFKNPRKMHTLAIKTPPLIIICNGVLHQQGNNAELPISLVEAIHHVAQLYHYPPHVELAIHKIKGYEIATNWLAFSY